MGVLPAVALHDWTKSSLYLGSFCASSILSMGGFAAAFGELTLRLDHAYSVKKGCMLCTSVVAMSVGILWLVLIYMGLLDEIFP